MSRSGSGRAALSAGRATFLSDLKTKVRSASIREVSSVIGSIEINLHLGPAEHFHYAMHEISRLRGADYIVANSHFLGRRPLVGRHPLGIRHAAQWSTDWQFC